MPTKNNAPRHCRPTADEPHLLEPLTVRPSAPHETERFEQFIVPHHYLKRRELGGEHLRDVATYQGQWLALAAWCAPTWPLKTRDAFIGWTDEQRRVRCPGVTPFRDVLIGVDAAAPRPRAARLAGTTPWPDAGPPGDCGRQNAAPRTPGTGPRR